MYLKWSLINRRVISAVLQRAFLIPLALLACLAAGLFVVEDSSGDLIQKAMLSAVAIAVLAAATLPRPESSPSPRFLLPLRSLTRQRAMEFFGLSILLGLLVLIVRHFEVESGAFQDKMMPLVFFGFLIHYFLPLNLRKEFFLLLSLGAFVGILGLIDTLWMILIGLVLIGICYIPIRIAYKAGLLTGAAILLVVSQAGWLPVPWSGAFWPIFGAIFMFRLIVFLYDLHHTTNRPRWDSTLSYFFLLPNVAFPLFPVVDFSTFRRTYYDRAEHEIYFRGVKWITWGVIHLMIFRALNHHLVVSPENVSSSSDLFLHIVPNFLLLVQVSGKFHLVTGILMLFGFNLPRTFRLFFFASGFNDFWRRANSYWRAFIVKVFYYPFYFWMRRSGPMARLALATGFAFLATWLLHSYQWYWLTGTPLLSVPDVTFWVVFGLLVLGNSLYEAKFGRKRKLGSLQLSLRERLSIGIRTIIVFFTIAILYSVWTSHSIGEWLSLWQRAFSAPLEYETVVLFLATAIVLGFGAQLAHTGSELNAGSQTAPVRFRQVFSCSVLVVILFLAGAPAVRVQLGENANRWLDSLKGSHLSEQESELLLRGYYENLTVVRHFNSELWELYSRKPRDWPLLQETEAARLTDTILGIELIPSTQIDFHGAKFSVNRWGMRGRGYDLVAPAGVYRVALLGPSFVMGSGVADEEVFGAVLERKFESAHAGFEFLNFALPGFSALEEMVAFETKALAFAPDALFLVAHDHERSILIRNLSGRIHSGVEIPYSFLEEVIEKANLSAQMTREQMELALRPFEQEVLDWVYGQFVAVSRENGILPVWVYIPSLERGNPQIAEQQLKDSASGAGFLVLDLSDVYQDLPVSTLIVAPWDRHPNARAHRLIADRLHQEILRHQELFHASRPALSRAMAD